MNLFSKQSAQNANGSSGTGFPIAKILRTLGIVLVAGSLVIGAGLKIFNGSLAKTAESLKQQKDGVFSEEDKKAAAAIIAVENNASSVENLLKSHVYVSEIFKSISDSTITLVQWTGCSLDTEKRRMDLDGQAADYSILAKQLVAFEQGGFEEVNLSNVTLGKEGGVEFKISAFFPAEKLQRK